MIWRYHWDIMRMIGNSLRLWTGHGELDYRLPMITPFLKGRQGTILNEHYWWLVNVMQFLKTHIWLGSEIVEVGRWWSFWALKWLEGTQDGTHELFQGFYTYFGHQSKYSIVACRILVVHFCSRPKFFQAWCGAIWGSRSPGAVFPSRKRPKWTMTSSGSGPATVVAPTRSLDWESLRIRFLYVLEDDSQMIPIYYWWFLYIPNKLDLFGNEPSQPFQPSSRTEAFVLLEGRCGARAKCFAARRIHRIHSLSGERHAQRVGNSASCSVVRLIVIDFYHIFS